MLNGVVWAVPPNPVRRFVLKYDLRRTIFEVRSANRDVFRSMFRDVMEERMNCDYRVNWLTIN